jgi:hypothetical protein
MSHKNKKSLVDQVKQSLDSKLAIGRSKHQDKLSEKERKEITSNYHSCISEYDLTKKELDNMKLIFKDLMKYTKKKSPAGDRYLPLSDYEINLFQTVKRINEGWRFYLL